LGVVSDDYFRLMRIGFVAGRAFRAEDPGGGRNVCIVNETLARHLFPGESAIGKTLLRGANADIKNEIVGVIRDVKSNGLNATVPDEVYYPMGQVGRPGMNVIARTAADPAALQSVIRGA